MNALHLGIAFRRSYIVLGCLALQSLGFFGSAQAINIKVDYRYDEATTNFFNTQQKKDALQAAADRYSAIITETLSGASLTGVPPNTDHRISFTHPGTGENFHVSAATSAANDALAPPNCSASTTCFVANEYRGPWSIAANDWILYAGGRPLTSAAQGGTGTGLNFESVFDSGSSHLNRGFRTSGSVNHLPVWGGFVAFDNDSINWHFDPDTTPDAGSVDFYSMALHEIGHALGLSGNSTDWNSLSSTPIATQFLGPQTLATYNADNAASVTSLNHESASNHHWQENAYNSRIFQNANPKLVATVGSDALQDLLMEPTANFTAMVKRFELTNVDVAALVDIGWSVVPQIYVQPGDYNGDGIVNAADYVVWRKGVATGNYATWRANFGESLGGAGGNSAGRNAVPEPSMLALCSLGAIIGFATQRRRHFCPLARRNLMMPPSLRGNQLSLTNARVSRATKC